MNTDQRAAQAGCQPRSLVTGATGFLGGRLARRLLRDGHAVTVLGRNTGAGAKLVAAGAKFVAADLRDARAVAEACQEQTYVFHCAALASPWGPYGAFYDANVRGTEHVVAGVKAGGVRRLIHVSSPSIYVERCDRHDIRESDPLPRKMFNHYAATKLLAEQIVHRAAEEGVETVTIRPQALFGPGDRTIIPRIIRASQRRGTPIIGGGGTAIDVTYVDNVVHALLLCMKAPSRALGRQYNITNGEPMAIYDLLKMVFTALGKPWKPRHIRYGAAYGASAAIEMLARFIPHCPEPPLTRYGVIVLGHSRTLNIDAARTELGYEPQQTVREGLQHFSHWWSREHGEAS